MKGKFYTLLIILFVWVCPSHAQIYRWVDENGRQHFSDRPPPGQVPSITPEPATPVTPNAPGVHNDYSPPAASQALELRKLLEAKEFSRLNSFIYKVQQEIEGDMSQEQKWPGLFVAFEYAGENWDQLFDEWVATSRSNYQPYLARAAYFTHMGWKARGTRFVKNTPEENFESMQRYYALAEADIREALRLNEKALYAYCLQINIYTSAGNHTDGYKTLQKALRHFPASLLVRRYFIRSLQPTWGGSLEAVENFAAQSQSQIPQNPLLAQLLGHTYYTQGHAAIVEKDYPKAVALFSQALTYGDHPNSLYFRGRGYFLQKQYGSALVDFTKLIGLSTDVADYYYWRARTLSAINRPAEAFNDINRAYALDAQNKPIQKLRQQLLTRIRMPAQSQATAVRNDSPVNQEAEALLTLANQAVDRGELAAAKDYLDQAIRLQPKEFRYYQRIDFVLVRMGRLRDILSYWNIYLVHQPKDGRAYMERSGTNYHLQDYKAARADAERALALGSKDAEKVLRHLDSLVR